MPKMKILETGQTSEEVVIMSWSPKMDLLALGNRKGNIQLHRLSWQKVWQTSLTIRGDAVVPELLAWHPEGLFLIVSSGTTTFVIDVECGKVVHSHEVPVLITSMKWCSSQYRHSMNDVLSTQSKQQSDYLRNDLKIQRLETNLSILFLGTCNGYVYAYTGGFLLGLCLQACEDGLTSQVIQMDASASLETFQFLTDEESGSDDLILSFNSFRNAYLPRIAPIIGPLGLKYILFLKNWAMIQSEISSLNEHWGRLVDCYTNYMTFGGAKDLEVARVDYLELLLTGMTCVEMELFLGEGGREKEAKKSTNSINTANASITEHLRTIKCSIVNLLTELNEIGGFLKQISGYEEANKLVVELRKSCNYLFLAILHVQSLVHNFVEVGLHFIHLVMNTIHSFNVQEVPDFIEEDADTDKVLEFLETIMDKDIFQFLIKNISLGYPENDNGATKKRSPFGEVNFPEKNALGAVVDDSERRDYLSFPKLLRDLLHKHGNSSEKHSMLMDLNEDEASEFLSNIIPTMNKLTKSLLCIPVLCSVSFEADTYQLARLPKSVYFESSSKTRESKERSSTSTYFSRKPFSMMMDSETSKTILTCLWTMRKVLFFEIDFKDCSKINVKSIILNFTESVYSTELFSESYVTAVCHISEKESKTAPKSIICQVQFRNFLTKVTPVDVSQLKSKCGGKSLLPTSVRIEVPGGITKACVPMNSTHVSYCLPIGGFVPSQLKVSGPRKVAALLADDHRTVLLLELETDLSETSCDETTEVSDSEDSSSNDGV